MEPKAEFLKKVSQPVRALTNASGMITGYLKIVEQLMKERAAQEAEKKSA